MAACLPARFSRRQMPPPGRYWGGSTGLEVRHTGRQPPPRRWASPPGQGCCGIRLTPQVPAPSLWPMKRRMRLSVSLVPPCLQLSASASPYLAPLFLACLLLLLWGALIPPPLSLSSLSGLISQPGSSSPSDLLLASALRRVHRGSLTHQSPPAACFSWTSVL